MSRYYSYHRRHTRRVDLAAPDVTHEFRAAYFAAEMPEAVLKADWRCFELLHFRCHVIRRWKRGVEPWCGRPTPKPELNQFVIINRANPSFDGETFVMSYLWLQSPSRFGNTELAAQFRFYDGIRHGAQPICWAVPPHLITPWWERPQ